LGHKWVLFLKGVKEFETFLQSDELTVFCRVLQALEYF